MTEAEELSNFSIKVASVNSDLEIQVTIDGAFPPPDHHVTASIYGHDDVSSDWYAGVNLTLTEGNVWVGRAADVVHEGWPHLVEVAALTPVDANSGEALQQKALKAGVDYKRSLHLIGDNEFRGSDCAATPDLELQRLADIRNERVNRTLRTGDGGSKEYRVAFLADGVLNTRSLYIPGVVLFPVNASTRGSDIPEMFNSLLAQSGWPSRMDPTKWIAEYSRRRPVVVAVAASVKAGSGGSAIQYVRDRVQSFLHLMSLLRGAEPQLISAVAEIRDPLGEWKPELAWIDGAPYGGNLIGGFISGEDQHSILASWDAIEADEKIQLWISLYSDSLREQRWDFKWFRLFNLLESIGLERYGDTSLVKDFSGAVIQKPDNRNILRNVKTKEARGKVYQTVRDASVLASVAESSFCANTGESLWDVARIWTDVRNAVAHEGGYRENDSVQNLTTRNQRVNAAFARQPKDSYLHGLDEAVRHVLGMLIAKRM
ncbi:hypothetical protein OG985_32585 [Streptomyces sp. NBC_00289]|uniref:hypothetical protein n=1 Tax=Streptomyces sp. NBC_00289 TaxID=2975703 RepID=UPI003244E0B7